MGENILVRIKEAQKDVHHIGDQLAAENVSFIWADVLKGVGSLLADLQTLLENPPSFAKASGDESEQVKKALFHVNEYLRLNYEPCDGFLDECKTIRTALLSLTAQVAHLQNVVKSSLELAENCLQLAGMGDYKNGNTDPTGSIDEGDVRASEYYYKLYEQLKVLKRENP